MTVTRTPLTTDLPVSLEEAKDRARVSHTEEDAAITSLIFAAALDVETATGLALLPQIVTYTADVWGGLVPLPVGPVLPDTTAIVEVIGAGGVPVPLLAEMWWIEAIARPMLWLTEPEEEWDYRLRMTYTAGLAATPEEMPHDLRLAIIDQVARLYDERGGVTGRGPSLSHHAARVIARYRGVAL